MTEPGLQQDFTETHHALLFGWIASAVIEAAGQPQGEAILRKAVRQYGNERGRRMALRATANRDKLNMANYLAYGEWKATPGNQHEMKVIAAAPDARVAMDQCPWYRAWRENGLVSYGRFYCQEIDQALAHGFSPDIRLEVHKTRPDGSETCEFVYHGANLVSLLRAGRKRSRLAESAVMPWDYHVGHLLTTMEKVVVQELGQAGQTAIQDALAEYSGRFGEQAARHVASFRSVDFDRLPSE